MFEQQFEVLRALRAHGAVRVPNALFIERDSALFGAPFFVMERAHGRVPVSTPPYAKVGWVAQATPAQRRRLWESAVHQLAAVQSVPLDSVRFLERANTPAGLEQEWAKYERFVGWLDADAPHPVLRAALARLRSIWPVNQPTGLVWGDARIGNMMFDDEFGVSAVLDWEQPSLGGALHDLAWFLRFAQALHGASADRPHLEGMGTREETIALWQRLTGHSVADLAWYEDFVELKCGCTGVRMSRLQNVTFFDDATLARRLKV
jgi:aminoglycoside phosphotransferase (APT) family kinase protein